MDTISERIIEDAFNRALEVRREIHMDPELSGSEYRTAERIHNFLTETGLEPEYCLDNRGVLCRIPGKSGKIALRADTDALPVTENTGYAFSSKNPGIMHACGHDIHTSALLGAASLLSEIKGEQGPEILLIFQPSEEVSPGGALELINAGLYPEDIDAVYGIHVAPGLEAGSISVKPGRDHSAVMEFDIRIKGKGGHGAYPEKAVDPVVILGETITSLQSIVSRELSPLDSAVVTIGRAEAGSIRNVIPDTAEISGTVRTFSEETQSFIKKRISEITRASAEACRGSAETVFNKSYPSGYNDPGLFRLIKEIFSEVLGRERVVIREKPLMSSEDFTYYQQKNPGIMIQIGADLPGKASSQIHSSDFLPSEEALRCGIRVFGELGLRTAPTRTSLH